MEIKIHKPTDRERKAEAELKAAKASIQPVKEKGRNDRVNRLIRERYSLSEELSILRKAILSSEARSADSEFAEYSAYAEKCIARVDADEGAGQ